MLKVVNVSKTFNPGTIDEKLALNNINLEVKDGDFITLLGSNGAGKSSLFNLISGKFLPDQGQIILEDEDITKQKDYQRSKKIGRLFQDPNQGTCPDLSILENLSLAYLQANNRGPLALLNKEDLQIIKDKLKQLNMGLENRLDTPIKLLSGGQRQALTLIMATLQKPKLLLLDEHTAALDPKMSQQIMALTNQIIKKDNITTLMITHNILDALNNGNRTIVMNQGRIIKDYSLQEKTQLKIEDILKLYNQF